MKYETTRNTNGVVVYNCEKGGDFTLKHIKDHRPEGHRHCIIRQFEGKCGAGDEWYFVLYLPHGIKDRSHLISVTSSLLGAYQALYRELKEGINPDDFTPNR